MGKLLFLVGLALTVVGGLVMVGVPFGKFPGDFVFRRNSFTLYLPIGTSVVVSALLTLIFMFLRR